MKKPILKCIQQLPEGYSTGTYNYKKYRVTKTIFNNGNSFKIYGEELGGNDFISLNYFIMTEKDLLKPCEMPEQKVMHFLENIILESAVKN